MDKTANAFLLASFGQHSNPGGVNALSVLPRVVLQHAGAVDHGINVLQMRQPIPSVPGARHIQLQRYRHIRPRLARHANDEMVCSRRAAATVEPIRPVAPTSRIFIPNPKTASAPRPQRGRGGRVPSRAGGCLGLRIPATPLNFAGPFLTNCPPLSRVSSGPDLQTLKAEEAVGEYVCLVPSCKAFVFRLEKLSIIFHTVW